ncbi:MAG: hypothetical protein GEU86_10520 [Actinophytocola sp.]|nr:hypothetical protein [Actinophytocola sp.]
MKRGRIFTAMVAAGLTAALGVPGSAAHAHPDQHGTLSGHLIGNGSEGDLELLGKADLTDSDDIVADVGIDPRGTYAYLAHWGKPTCAASSEAGGVTDPDAGVFVVDIADLENPKQVGFIPHSQDSRPGEGVQALNISTKFFDGVMLVTNNEHCGKNGKGGVTLTDVTDPLKPKRLSQHFGDRGFADTNDIHSAFAWNDGDKAYVVMTDNFETADVDILDITNPMRPRLITELNLNTFSGGPIFQPELGLDESNLHDMIVKQIDGRWIMLLSYWDGGYVRLDVTDPSRPTFIHDTDYPDVDPLLALRTGTELPPEGNGHQAEFTADNKFFIGTDEDFAPYRPHFLIESGPNTGEYPAGEFGFTPQIQTSLPDGKINGTVVYGGYGCPGDAVPDAMTAIPTVDPDEERVVVFQRGPVGDPSASGEACFFSEKIEAGQNAGYDAVVVANHHSGAQFGDAADARACGSQGHVYDKTAPAVCIGHRAMHLLFDTAPDYSANYSGDEPAVGTVGEQVSFTPQFDGWGYVWLFDAETGQAVDAYAIPQAHDEGFAEGFGDLTVHEVATDPNDASRAYLSYYSGGMRALEIQCEDPDDTSTCSLVETGSYLSETGSDFWGVEAFTRDGQTYVAGSDRDDGLYLFSPARP